MTTDVATTSEAQPSSSEPTTEKDQPSSSVEAAVEKEPQSTASLLQELQLLECYLGSMLLDIPMLNAAKSEREWDWFFHKLEEGFMVAEVEQDHLKLKLAKRFMRGRQLTVWCYLVKEAPEPKCYETIRDKMYNMFFPQSDYYNSLMELFGGYRENGNESPRRKMSLVGVKLVIGTAKETMQRVSKRYNREMPPEAFWYQFALRLMTPAVKELFDSKLAELNPAAAAATTIAAVEGATAKEGDGGTAGEPSATAAVLDETTGRPPEDAEAAAGGEPTAAVVLVTYPDIHIEHMLNSIKDPNPRSMRAPHKFRRTVRKNRPHGTNAGKKSTATATGTANSPSAKIANQQQAAYPAASAPVTVDN